MPLVKRVPGAQAWGHAPGAQTQADTATISVNKFFSQPRNACAPAATNTPCQALRSGCTARDVTAHPAIYGSCRFLYTQKMQA